MRSSDPVESVFWQLNDPEWLRTQYLDLGRTAEDLAAEIGCGTTAVVRHLRRHGLRKHRDIDEAWLRREHVERGRSLMELAHELGCSDGAVARARDRLGIEPQSRRIDQLRDGRWLRAQVAAGRTHRDIARELGCTRQAVSMALRRSAT